MFDIGAVMVGKATAEPSLPTGALPTGVDEALRSLGPYPLLQLLVAAVVVTVGTLIYVKTAVNALRKDEPAPSPPKAGGSDVHMHFDGPLVEALKTLKQIAASLDALVKEVPDAAKMLISTREDIIRRIDDTRHALRNEQHKGLQEFEAALSSLRAEMQREIRDGERKVEAIEGQLRDLGRAVGQLEGRFTGRSR